MAALSIHAVRASPAVFPREARNASPASLPLPLGRSGDARNTRRGMKKAVVSTTWARYGEEEEE